MAIPNNAQNHKSPTSPSWSGLSFSSSQHGPGFRAAPLLSNADAHERRQVIVPGQTVDKVHLLLQGRCSIRRRAKRKPIGQILQGNASSSSFVDASRAIVIVTRVLAACWYWTRAHDGVDQYTTAVSETCCSC